MAGLSRRTLLSSTVLGAGALVILAACGGSGDGGDDSADGERGGTDGPGLADGAQLRRFGPDGLAVAGEPTRLMAAFVDADGVFLDDVPGAVELRITTIDGIEVAGLAPITATRHERGIPRPFFPFTVTLADPGTYVFAVTAADGRPVTGSGLQVPFTVSDGRTIAPVPRPGQPLPPVDTPTAANPGTVKELCTAETPCSFHEVSLADALREGRPIAYLIGTPAHCQTGVCGPILDLMIEASARFPTVRFVHAEPYDDFQAQETSEATKAYSLFYEPVLFLARADGTIDQRLDYLLDADELDEGLTRISA